MLRCMGESSMELNFNFVANQKAYDEEKQIFYFIVKYRVG